MDRNQSIPEPVYELCYVIEERMVNGVVATDHLPNIDRQQRLPIIITIYLFPTFHGSLSLAGHRYAAAAAAATVRSNNTSMLFS